MTVRKSAVIIAKVITEFLINNNCDKSNSNCNNKNFNNNLVTSIIVAVITVTVKIVTVIIVKQYLRFKAHMKLLTPFSYSVTAST